MGVPPFLLTAYTLLNLRMGEPFGPPVSVVVSCKSFLSVIRRAGSCVGFGWEVDGQRKINRVIQKSRLRLLFRDHGSDHQRPNKS